MRGDYDAAPHEIGGHGPRGSSGFSLPKCCVTFPRNVALRHHLATTFRWQGGSAVAHGHLLRHLALPLRYLHSPTSRPSKTLFPTITVGLSCPRRFGFGPEPTFKSPRRNPSL